VGSFRHTTFLFLPLVFRADIGVGFQPCQLRSKASGVRRPSYAALLLRLSDVAAGPSAFRVAVTSVSSIPMRDQSAGFVRAH
jgi:hypothetical protein